MEIGIGGYVEKANAMTVPCDVAYRQPTVEERLIQQKQRLESNLKDVNDALNALQENPNVLKVINLISKVNY